MLKNRRKYDTESISSRGEGYPNLVRGLAITEPFQVLSSDISYIRTKEGYEYLCQVKDVFRGLIVAQKMSERMKVELVAETMRI